MLINGKVTEEEIMASLRDSKVRHFHSAFQFLDAHMGVRRGCYSVIMGTSGCGKSGLAQAMGVQLASSPGVRVLMILTEEAKTNYAGPMFMYAKMAGGDLSQVDFFEESSMDHDKLKTHDQFLAAIKDVIVSSFADVVILDNVSTGRLYGTGTAVWDQEKTTWMIKNLAKDLNIHICCVVHTKKDITDNSPRLNTISDHQGAASLGKEASFFYALQKFTNNGQVHVFLRTLKHRGYPDANGTYSLRYDKDFRVYMGDQKVDFDKVKEVFKIRDSLGQSK